MGFIADFSKIRLSLDFGEADFCFFFSQGEIHSSGSLYMEHVLVVLVGGSLSNFFEQIGCLGGSGERSYDIHYLYFALGAIRAM